MAGAAIATTMNKLPKHNSYKLKYNTDTAEELEGEVIDIIYSGYANGKAKGVELIIESAGELIPVKLGPAWYIENQNVPFKRGEHVIVRGSRIQNKKENFVIGSSIKYGDRVLNLRDKNGHPHWEAWNIEDRSISTKID
jgi:hypothetical protein